MICKKCGNNLDDDSNFCKKCGSPIAEEIISVKPAKKKYEKRTPEESEKWKNKWSWLLYLIIIGIVLLFAIIAFIINNGNNPKINYENYQKIEIGMSYEQVYEILGDCDENNAEGHQHQICAWSKNDDTKITIELADNKVTKKSQTGLDP